MSKGRHQLPNPAKENPVIESPAGDKTQTLSGLNWRSQKSQSFFIKPPEDLVLIKLGILIIKLKIIACLSAPPRKLVFPFFKS